MSGVRLHVISREDLGAIVDLLVRRYDAIDVVVRGQMGIVSATVPAAAVDQIRREPSIDAVSRDLVREVSGGGS